MSGPSLRREGDTFILVFHDDQIGVGVERLQDSRDGLHAELTFDSAAPGYRGRIRGPDRLNLLSTQSKNALAKILAEQINHIDWHDLLGDVCALVIAEWRKPAPVVDLAQGGVEPVDYLLPGIPKSESVLVYGDGESAKSLLTLLIAVAARTGVVLPWAAHVSEPLVTMVLDFETNEATVRSRFQRIVRGYGLAETPSLLYRQCTRPLVDLVDTLRVDRDRLGIGLFIVDSLSFACAGSLNEDDAARGALNALRQLSPATRLCVAHVSQESAKATKGGVAPFGSRFWFNGMRSGFEVRKAEDSGSSTLDLGVYHRKSNDGQRERPFAVRVNFDGTTGPITFHRGELGDSPDLIGRTSLSTRIRAALRSGQRNTVELAEEVDASEATVRYTVRKMPDVVQINPGTGRGNPSTWGLSS